MQLVAREVESHPRLKGKLAPLMVPNRGDGLLLPAVAHHARRRRASRLGL